MLYIPDIVSEPDPVDGHISRECKAKHLLGLQAEDFSQTHHLVSWSEDVADHFWAAAHGGDVDACFGKAVLTSTEKKLILDLATVANGWWIAHPNFSDPGDSFVPLDKWLEGVAARGWSSRKNWHIRHPALIYRRVHFPSAAAQFKQT